MATKYRTAVMKVISNYAPGTQSLIVALDALINTAMDRTREENRDEIAEATCLGTLHPESEASGLICKKCFDALEAGRLPPEENEAGVRLSPAEAEAEDKIAAQVNMLLGITDED